MPALGRLGTETPAQQRPEPDAGSRFARPALLRPGTLGRPEMNPKPSALTWLALGAALAEAAVAGAALVKMGGRPLALFTPFTLWVLLPFALVAATIARRPSPFVGVLALLAAGLFGSVAYFDLLFPTSRIRSTAALAFVFIPIWQLALYGCALGVSFVFDVRGRRLQGGRLAAQQFRAVAPLPDVSGTVLGAGAIPSVRCPACGAAASFGASECRTCEQAFEYPKQ